MYQSGPVYKNTDHAELYRKPTTERQWRPTASRFNLMSGKSYRYVKRRSIRRVRTRWRSVFQPADFGRSVNPLRIIGDDQNAFVRFRVLEFYKQKLILKYRGGPRPIESLQRLGNTALKLPLNERLVATMAGAKYPVIRSTNVFRAVKLAFIRLKRFFKTFTSMHRDDVKCELRLKSKNFSKRHSILFDNAVSIINAENIVEIHQ